MAYGNGGTLNHGLAGYNVAPGNQASCAEPTQVFPPDSPSRIRDGISESEGRCAELHEILSAVERRFETALSPAPPKMTGNAADANVPMRSHLTERLSGVNHELALLKSRLVDLLNRVEV